MASNKQSQKLRLKLLVDKKENRVVLAECQRDFIDVLFSFLTLPVGTIVRVLEKQSSLGCMDTLYQSVQELDPPLMETEACKAMLLRPRSAAEEACEDLELNVDDAQPRFVFRCSNWDCCSKNFRLYSPVEGSKCPCGLPMGTGIVSTKVGASQDGVFVKQMGNFMIYDDLHVLPASSAGALSVLSDVDGDTVLEEMDVTIGRKEMLNLLKASLLSDEPLTDAFLTKLNVKDRHTGKIVKHQRPSTRKYETAAESKGLQMKLILSKSSNTVLYAEAGGDVVDFLLSFLTFPVGSIIKLLDKFSCMGRLDNLYESVEDMVDVHGLLHYDKCHTKLLSPELAPMFACASQLLSIQEQASRISTIPGCEDCFTQSVPSVGSKCKHGIEDATICAVNPKLPGSGTKSGGRFTKEEQVFMITDELEVKPLSSISAIHTIRKWGIAVSDIVAREVSLGETEGLSLLKESLRSRRVLSSVFCHRERIRSSLPEEVLTGNKQFC